MSHKHLITAADLPTIPLRQNLLPHELQPIPFASQTEYRNPKRSNIQSARSGRRVATSRSTEISCLSDTSVIGGDFMEMEEESAHKKARWGSVHHEPDDVPLTTEEGQGEGSSEQGELTTNSLRYSPRPYVNMRVGILSDDRQYYYGTLIKFCSKGRYAGRYLIRFDDFPNEDTPRENYIHLENEEWKTDDETSPPSSTNSHTHFSQILPKYSLPKTLKTNFDRIKKALIAFLQKRPETVLPCFDINNPPNCPHELIDYLFQPSDEPPKHICQRHEGPKQTSWFFPLLLSTEDVYPILSKFEKGFKFRQKSKGKTTLKDAQDNLFGKTSQSSGNTEDQKHRNAIRATVIKCGCLDLIPSKKGGLGCDMKIKANIVKLSLYFNVSFAEFITDYQHSIEIPQTTWPPPSPSPFPPPRFCERCRNQLAHQPLSPDRWMYSSNSSNSSTAISFSTVPLLPTNLSPVDSPTDSPVESPVESPTPFVDGTRYPNMMDIEQDGGSIIVDPHQHQHQHQHPHQRQYQHLSRMTGTATDQTTVFAQQDLLQPLPFSQALAGEYRNEKRSNIQSPGSRSGSGRRVAASGSTEISCISDTSVIGGDIMEMEEESKIWRSVHHEPEEVPLTTEEGQGEGSSEQGDITTSSLRYSSIHKKQLNSTISPTARHTPKENEIDNNDGQRHQGESQGEERQGDKEQFDPTILVECILSNKCREVKTILQTKHAILKEQRLFEESFHFEGKDLLLHVIRYGWLQMVDLLLDFQSFDFKKSETQYFSCAVYLGHERLARSLVNRNVDLNEETISGYTPLLIAVFIGNVYLVQMLLQFCAEITCQLKGGINTIHLAVEICNVSFKNNSTNMNYYKIIERIHDEDKSLISKRTSFNNATPLTMAVKCGNIGLVRHLIKIGGDDVKINSQSALRLAWELKNDFPEVWCLMCQFGDAIEEEMSDDEPPTDNSASLLSSLPSDTTSSPTDGQTDEFLRSVFRSAHINEEFIDNFRPLKITTNQQLRQLTDIEWKQLLPKRIPRAKLRSYIKLDQKSVDFDKDVQLTRRLFRSLSFNKVKKKIRARGSSAAT